MKKNIAEKILHFKALYARLPAGGVGHAFPDDAACEARLRDVVWPGGATCPNCGSADARPLPKGKKLRCRACRVQFSLKSVTLFRRSRLPLRWWFLAAEHFLSAHARGRAHALLTEERFAKDLGVARMTARKTLAALRSDLARDDGGLFGDLLCAPTRTDIAGDA